MKSLKIILATLAISAATAMAPASAATVNVTKQGSNAFVDATGQNGWWQSVSYTLNGTSRSATAGMFRLTATDASGKVQDFLAFCLEPLEWLTLPKDHTVGSSLSAPILDRLGALVSNAFSLVTNSSSAAAFQMAAWEIANESGASLNLGNGGFKMTNASATSQSLAQGWLNSIASGSWTSSGRLTILTAPGTQDLLTNIAPVPVPAAGVMLLGGLAGLGALRRRRKAA
ncbi:MAG TPA: VPLPA-CTERM sorting domain-containing protein [Albidovulum sp.]|uniref:VPLPA-CTERM sorting domain-containing protein n=1 Tax=Albidovulum sp. TaxID=1872424 RepID=UPI002B7B12D1|nr:VPLPA-CTERM sorting domain-containing protein [Albidovulum sp.]